MTLTLSLRLIPSLYTLKEPKERFKLRHQVSQVMGRLSVASTKQTLMEKPRQKALSWFPSRWRLQLTYSFSTYRVIYIVCSQIKSYHRMRPKSFGIKLHQQMNLLLFSRQVSFTTHSNADQASYWLKLYSQACKQTASKTPQKLLTTKVGQLCTSLQKQ